MTEAAPSRSSCRPKTARSSARSRRSRSTSRGGRKSPTSSTPRAVSAGSTSPCSACWTLGRGPDPLEDGRARRYAVELHGLPPSAMVAVDSLTASAVLDDHPLRLPYARPGGPARELAWAEEALAGCGREPSGRPRQMRTWNLSSIWSIPTRRNGLVEERAAVLRARGRDHRVARRPGAAAAPRVGRRPCADGRHRGRRPVRRRASDPRAPSTSSLRFRIASPAASTSSSRSAFPTGGGRHCARASTTSSTGTATSSTLPTRARSTRVLRGSTSDARPSTRAVCR